MSPSPLDPIYRDHYGRLLAGLIRVVRDVDLAEEALQDAFADAVTRWGGDAEGTPERPTAWLFAAARHKAIDRIRRRVMESEHAATLRALEEDRSEAPAPEDPLRLLFTCCHPTLPPEAQVALTLRTLSGLTTEEIARAFLVPAATMAQRLVRAKGKIREERIPYEVPEASELEARLDGVMATLYLVFNEGYSATFGDAIVRRDLAREAIQLARLLVELLPSEGEARGLLALMLLHDARREARQTASGDLVRLEDQDRSLWDTKQIEEGAGLVEGALSSGPPGPYALQAAIAALHARAPRADATDWPQIAALYSLLHRAQPTPIVELNRAVAIAMADGPELGLALLDRLEQRGDLTSYHLVPAARADLLARLGRHEEALASYDRALALATNAAERRFLEGRRAAVGPTRGR